MLNLLGGGRYLYGYRDPQENIVTKLHGGPIIKRLVLTILKIHFNGFVDLPTIVDFVYGGLPDGGPNNPKNNIAVIVHRFRQQGYIIDQQFGLGYRLRKVP